MTLQEQPVPSSNVSRRAFVRAGGLTIGGVVATTAVHLPSPVHAVAGAALHITHGVVTGDVSHQGALIWSRASGPGRMRVVWGAGDPASSAPAGETAAQPITAERDFTARFRLDGLAADTDHWYRVVADDGTTSAASPVARFRTAPDPRKPARVRFTWGGDAGQGMANRPPFPAFGSIDAEDPAFFVFNGDTIYGDSTTPVGPGAKTRQEFWAKYKENREDPLFQALALSTPMVVNWDDHEVDNDFRGNVPTLGPGRQAFTDYWPVSSRPPTTTYRSFRWGSELEVFVLDNRQFADPLDAPDGPEKTMLGEAQRNWLAAGVRSSSARWKVIVTSCPLSILRSATPPQDDWVSYEHELGWLLNGWRAAGVVDVVWLTADVHWGQAIEYPGYGMWEFVGCPIGANPRVASRPLSPTFGPQERFLGLSERYYGSVLVDPDTATMTVDLKTQDGTIRHRTEITSARS